MTIKHKRATIKQVALTAGVSTQTVSRVVNNRPDVSAETRERVQRIIDELSYRPSALARSLIQQRSYTLGVVTAGLKYIGPSRTLSGITYAAEKSGYALLLKELPSFDAPSVEPVLQAFDERHVDGIIWAVPEVGENRGWLGQLPLDVDVPIVFLTMQLRGNIPVVTIDNYLGGKLATGHLVEQGYRHIGHISGPLDWWEARLRKQAWSDSLPHHILDESESGWVEGNWSSASGYQAFVKLLDQYPGLDAVFAANDQMALGAIQAAWQKGLRVPQDIGIVGFDNIPESSYYCPALTTVQSEQYDVGRMAVEKVIQIIETDKPAQEAVGFEPVILTPTLIVRQSSMRLSAQS